MPIRTDIHDERLKKNNVRTGSTQEYLDIAEIKNDIVILNNGSLRAVVMCSSVNFALKSSQEQEGLIFGYQQFLNSLDFPIQIVINSRSIDLSEYLLFLKDVYRQQENELLKLQVAEYTDFITGLVEVSSIMEKHFYLVIPFSLGESREEGNIFERFKTAFNPKQALGRSEKDFQRYRSQIWQRVNHVVAGLTTMGVKGVPLKTQELIELYYSLYNPSGTVGQGGLERIDELDIEQG